MRSNNTSKKVIPYIVYDSMSNRYGMTYKNEKLDLHYKSDMDDSAYPKMYKVDSSGKFKTKIEAANFFKNILEALDELNIWSEQGKMMFTIEYNSLSISEDFELNSSHFTATGNLYMIKNYEKLANDVIKKGLVDKAFVRQTYGSFIDEVYKNFKDNINYVAYGKFEPILETKRDIEIKKKLIDTIIGFYDENDVIYNLRDPEYVKRCVAKEIENREFDSECACGSYDEFQKCVRSKLMDKLFFGIYPEKIDNKKYFLLEGERRYYNKMALKKYERYKVLILEAYDSPKVKEYEKKIRQNENVKKRIDHLPKKIQDAWIKTMANAYYFYHDKKGLKKETATKRAAMTAWSVVNKLTGKEK